MYGIGCATGSCLRCRIMLSFFFKDAMYIGFLTHGLLQSIEWGFSVKFSSTWVKCFGFYIFSKKKLPSCHRTHFLWRWRNCTSSPCSHIARFWNRDTRLVLNERWIDQFVKRYQIIFHSGTFPCLHVKLLLKR